MASLFSFLKSEYLVAALAKNLLGFFIFGRGGLLLAEALMLDIFLRGSWLFEKAQEFPEIVLVFSEGLETLTT